MPKTVSIGTQDFEYLRIRDCFYMVDLAKKYHITSNRESGFGSNDIYHKELYAGKLHVRFCNRPAL